MSELIENFFNLDTLLTVYPLLLAGLKVTLVIAACTVLPGVLAGLGIATLYSLHVRWLNWLLIGYVDFFRAFPPLVLLIFIYYGFPFIGITVAPILSVVLAFTLNSSSFFGEVFRAGIEGVPKGHLEAARSTGLSRMQTHCYIVVPQAVRTVASDLVGNALEVVKLSAIASVVAVPELLRMARLAQSSTYNATPVIAAAFIYLALLWPVVRLMSKFERQMLVGRK